MPDVFISHVEEDTDVAEEIARGLEAAGYATWYYERDSLAGVPYLEQVGLEIDRCQALVLIVSPASWGSFQVTREVERAYEGGKRLIPVLRGVTHAEFQTRQQIWRQAVGTAASVSIPPAGVGAILPRITAGLKFLGIEPSGQPVTVQGEPPQPAPPPTAQGKPRPAGQVIALIQGIIGHYGFSIRVWAAVAGVILVAVLFAWTDAFASPHAGLPTTTPTRYLSPTRAITATPTRTFTPVPTKPVAATATSLAVPSVARTATATALATATAPVTPSLPRTSTPIGTPTPGAVTTPEPVKLYSLPLNNPSGVVYDGSALCVQFASRLARLELIEAEARFRLSSQDCGVPGLGGGWDASGNQFWSLIQGAIALRDRTGAITVTLSVTKEFVGTPTNLAWDGAYLWATSSEGALYKLQASGSNVLQVVDSFAPVLGQFPTSRASGLAWDGKSLWAQADTHVSRLDGVGRITCRLYAQGGGSWWSWRGLAWDGRFLWTAHTEANVLARLDPAGCR